MNGWRQVLLEFPFLGTIWDALIIIVPFSALFAFSGLLFVSSCAKIISVATRRSAFDKCARQLAFLALILGWALIVGGRVWLYYSRPDASDEDASAFLSELSWLLLSLSALLTTVYYTLWRLLKNMPVLHVTIGVIAASQNCLALLSILLTVTAFSSETSSLESLFQLPAVFPAEGDMKIWTAAVYMVPLLFGLAGAYGCAWLYARRKRDDYGRDYYNRMIPWLAGWAKNSWALLLCVYVFSLAFQIWTVYDNSGQLPEEIFELAGVLLFWVIPVVAWIFIRKTAFPLRHFWAALLAALIASVFTLPWYQAARVI